MLNFLLLALAHCGIGWAQEPAAPAAAETEPAEPPATEAPPAAPSFVALIDPAIANQLGLTEKQSTDIRKIVAERAEALRDAPENERPAIIAAAEERLAAVLSDDQRAAWQRIVKAGKLGADAPEKTLRFSFRFQPWADVLSWFADQAGLSLVLDAPPPGSFNYTDSREYSVAEAIDLLNGVLLTKGHTLIRRERMLMVIDLSEELPLDLVPRVTQDELKDRGQFEIVSMLFPVDNRDPAQVVAEITPLLGPHGKATPLPATRQILVTETAGKMRAIAAVIESIPKPDTPAPPSAPGEPEKPVLAVYPLGTIDSNAAVETLAALMPDAKVVYDPRLAQLDVYATPTQHAAVSAALTQMRTETPTERQPEMKVYPLDDADPKNVLEFLAQVVPGARLAVDPKTGNLAAWAPASQQQLIAAAIEQLDRAPAPGERLVLEIYTLRKVEPSTLAATLATLVPEARASAGSTPGRLVVYASSADHERIKTLAARLDADLPPEEQPKLAIYPFAHRDASSVIALSAKLAPKAQVTFDNRAKHISVIGTAAEQEAVKEAIAQVEAATPDEGEETFKVYQVSARNRAKITAAIAALADELPGIRTIPDAQTGELAVWARPAQHAIVAAVVEQLDRQAPAGNQPRVEVYAIEKANPVPLADMLTVVVPGARLSADRTNRTLAAWATPDEHKVIRAAVEQMENKLPPEKSPTVVVYPLGRANGATSLSVLQSLVPAARVTVDADTGSVVAWGTPEDHEALSAAIEQMESQPSAGQKRTLGVYPIGQAEASSLVALLQSAVREARVMADAQNRNILAWATEEEQAVIRESIERLRSQATAEQLPAARVYRLTSADPNAVLTAVQGLIPTSRVALDTRQGGLVVTALPAEHERIAAAVAEMDRPADEANAPVVRVYSLEVAQASNVYSALSTLFSTRPEVRLSLDPTTQKLIAWAPAAQQETIRSVVEQVEGAGSPEKSLQLEVHSLGTADSQAVLEALAPLFAKFPEVRLSTSRRSGHLVAVARTDQQATIRATIEEMQNAPQEIEVFQLAVLDPFTAQMSLERLFESDGSGPRGEDPPKIDSDPTTGQLVVRGSREQLAQIREVLAKMGEPLIAADTATRGTGKLRVIRMPGHEVEAAMAELSRVWPQLRRNPIRVVTPSAVAPTLRESRDRDDEPEPSPSPEDSDPPPPSDETPDESCCLFDDEQPTPDESNADEQQEAPTESTDEETPPPVIVAPGDDRITISSDDLEALDQLEALLRSMAQGAGPGGREFTVFNLRNANASDMAETLEELFRGGFLGGRGSGVVRIVPDARLNALVVQAGRSDLRAIEYLLEVLDSSDVPETLVATKPKVIPIHNARADEIAEVLRDVYETQLRQGGAKLPIPSGVPRELASVLQQIGANNAGPLMTISVDELTNSIIALAPGPLLMEVEQLVASLDKAAADPARVVRVVPLKKANIEAVEEAIQRITGSEGGGGFRRRSRRNAAAN